MFVWRPHIHGADIITTPDIIIDLALGSESWGPPPGGNISPAWVIVAAQGAPLVTVGFLRDGWPWRISRHAWRATDVTGPYAHLVLSRESPSGKARTPVEALLPTGLRRGEARFDTAGLTTVRDPDWCRVTLACESRGWSVSHAVRFSMTQESLA